MDESQPLIIKKIGLAIFKNKKILMARYKDANVFYFVGGQLHPGETELDCLKRKTPDEIGVEIVESSVKELGEFQDKADGRENTLVSIKLFTADLQNEPKPNNDVGELQYFDSTVDPNLVSAIAVNKIMPRLKEQGYIN